MAAGAKELMKRFAGWKVTIIPAGKKCTYASLEDQIAELDKLKADKDAEAAKNARKQFHIGSHGV